MNGASRLTPMQLAARVERQRDGRPDIARMTNEERRQAGLMDRQQAAEHEHLASVPQSRLAERVRGPVLDDIWAGMDSEQAGAAIWKAWSEAGHLEKGCAGWSKDFLATEIRCACGGTFPVPEGAAAA